MTDFPSLREKINRRNALRSQSTLTADEKSELQRIREELLAEVPGMLDRLTKALKKEYGEPGISGAGADHSAKEP